MQRPPLLALTPFAVIALVGACSGAPTDSPELDDVAQSEAQIINGSLDTTHQAVVAVLSNNSACTGTIIAVQAPYAFILTAAHCVDDPPQVVVQGNDYNSGGAITYNVQDYQAHPGYNGSVNDFAMVRVTGASAATPTMAVLTPGEDNISNGAQCTHVGYGVINASPQQGTTQRHVTTGSVVDTTSLTLTFNAMSSGVCFGDSGGPNLYQNKVAGVNSSVSTSNCNGYSFSGRASAVLNSFIVPFINNAPPPPVDCNGCFEAATTGSGSCIGSVNACFGDTSCNDLVACYNGCSSQSCFNTCTQMHGAGLDLYNAIFACVCDSACATECESASMCQGTGGSPPSTSAVAQSSVAADAAATTGVGGAGGATGVGGADASNGPSTGSSWVPGNNEDKSPQGEVLSSCASSGAGTDGPESNGAAWLLMVAATSMLFRRKRAS